MRRRDKRLGIFRRRPSRLLRLGNDACATDVSCQVPRVGVECFGGLYTLLLGILYVIVRSYSSSVATGILVVGLVAMVTDCNSYYNSLRPSQMLNVILETFTLHVG
jgi:hypothetical protein